MAKKADNATINHRVEVVLTLMLQGWRSTSIVQSLSPKWDMTERQIGNYIAKARKLIDEEAEKRRENAFNDHIEARLELYRTTKDERLKLEILKDLDKLLGLYPAKKMEHSGEVVISDRERLDRLVALADRARERGSKKAD